MLSQGLSLGWASPALEKLSHSENTPLPGGALTNSQISWIGYENLENSSN